jgi:polar amino acid transport system substrate-binding protein
MPRTRSETSCGHRVGIAARAAASAAAMVLLLVGVFPAAAATLDRVRDTGKLTLGYRTDARPFSFKDDGGKPAGYSVALCQKIAEQIQADLKLPNPSVEWVPVTLDGRFDAVQEGKVDLLCGADTVTLTRRKNVSFSIPTFPAGIGAVMRSDRSFPLRALLTGGDASSHPIWRGEPARALLQKTTFSVLTGTTSQATLMNRLAELQLDVNVVPVDNYKVGIERVLDRQSDVFFGDRPILIESVTRSSSGEDLVVLDRQFTYENIALVLSRGDEDFRLVVDQQLSRLYSSKDFYAEYTKWFGRPNLSTLVFYLRAALPND